jgi:hypothetical protein
MKTAKSTTGKKSEFTKAQAVFVNFSTEYIKNWTNGRLKHYVDQPVVIPVGDYGFLIGPYKIDSKSKNCWRTEQADGKHIHDFVSRSNAVVYCLREIQNRPDAREILELDRQLGKLDNDIAFYEHTLKTTKNQFKNITILNRYIDAKLQRRNVLNILKKTLNLAKYLKFGNTPL